MKPITKTYLLLFTCLFLLAACQKEEDVPAPYTETVQLIISVPTATANTRIGDPGTAVDEGADWNQLAVILAYTDDSDVTLPGGSKVQVTTISKDDFETLPFYNNTQYRLLAIDAQPGEVYIYGVTYSDGVNGNPADDISNCMTNAEVQALTISNDYTKPTDGTTIDYAKFVSVATGYYKTTGNQPAEFTIQEGGTGQVGGTIPTMTLTRLAAKIDIQWDAADAYPEGYTDVKVKDFSYNGKEFGRLFPEVTLPTDITINNTDKSWTFYNTSEISQRNGRVYHYTFPDGVSVPSVKFNITATDNNNTTTTKQYTLNFQEALKQATWYKVNATIKGITGSGTITLGDNSGTSVGGG
ncbi:hypothetical protein [uncultured Bacteroides sp.]|uniref:hypothetical protein n=1 Tax=uncultured Bacteroides sp. TaxID=162156 RepID=UPI0026126F09|nr:hypothetical protein [uncultured Bacteroides sp.]